MQVTYLGIEHELETGNAVCVQIRVSTGPTQDQELWREEVLPGKLLASC